jgi:hypothetical protein
MSLPVIIYSRFLKSEKTYGQHPCIDLGILLYLVPYDSDLS